MIRLGDIMRPGSAARIQALLNRSFIGFTKIQHYVLYFTSPSELTFVAATGTGLAADHGNLNNGLGTPTGSQGRLAIASETRTFFEPCASSSPFESPLRTLGGDGPTSGAV